MWHQRPLLEGWSERVRRKVDHRRSEALLNMSDTQRKIWFEFIEADCWVKHRVSNLQKRSGANANRTFSLFIAAATARLSNRVCFHDDVLRPKSSLLVL